MSNIDVSLIIPVYNETERLERGLKEAATYLSKQPYTSELVIVDDGSDIPVVIARKKPGIRVIRLPRNTGKGAAIRTGVRSSRGVKVAFCDIDMSVPIGTLKLLLKKLDDAPVVIGSRRIDRADIRVHQSWVRETLGRVFTWLSNVICRTDVADATCGFKGFRRDTADFLFSRSRIDRWVFDTEILFLARKHAINIGQIPVVWSNRSGSKVRAGDSIRSFVDLFLIRLYDLSGKYA